MTSPWHPTLLAAASAAVEAMPAYDVNPRVGCVLLGDDGAVLAVGAHRGAGSVHAEVAALAAAGERARGSTAVVTLAPCDHVGLTGSCAQALAAAGVARVVYAVDDPSGHADSTTTTLRDAGIDVVGPVDRELGARVLGSWLTRYRTGLPYVVWKVASSLDGRIVDDAGTSKWITGEAARADVQQLRRSVGAIVTSTQTVLVDDPQMTVRAADVTRQPLRVVVGEREIPADARIRGDGHDLLHLRTRDVRAALQVVAARGVHRVLAECGARLAGALLEAGLVDEVVWYHAGMLLGDGPTPASGGLTPLLETAKRWQPSDVRIIGHDIRSTWHAAGRSASTTQAGE